MLTKTGLEKREISNDIESFRSYLDIQNNINTKFLYTDVRSNGIASTEIKYLGQEDLIIQSVTYSNTYKFKKILGNNHGIVSHIYYDSNFITILEEYIEGDIPYYRLERIDSIINFECAKK